MRLLPQKHGICENLLKIPCKTELQKMSTKYMTHKNTCNILLMYYIYYISLLIKLYIC